MTQIRFSTQVQIDANKDFNAKKITNLAAGTGANDATRLAQVETLISNAISTVGNTMHTPVADLAAIKALPEATQVDKEIVLVETLGLYRYDAQSSATGDDNLVITPTDTTGAGRWLKMSASLTSHNLLSNFDGGTTGQYYHLTAAEHTLVGTVESGADVTDAVNVGTSMAGVSTKTAIVDTDTFAFNDSESTNVLKKTTWSNIKSVLKTYFDTLYNLYVHPNHSGDVTSVADGATTIANNAVTNAKAAQMATQTIKGRTTTGTGNSEDLSVAQVKTMLGLVTGNLALRTYRSVVNETPNSTIVIFTITTSTAVINSTEEVFLNGILQNVGSGNDYTITYGTTNTITFVSAPTTGDVILVNYSL